MTGSQTHRKIVALLAADVVGYSRLAGTDEDRTLARLRALRSDLIETFATVSARSGLMHRSNSATLFDHLFGLNQQVCWNGDAQCLRGLEVDHQFELRRLLNR
jgi:adenylate cyclase